MSVVSAAELGARINELEAELAAERAPKPAKFTVKMALGGELVLRKGSELQFTMAFMREDGKLILNGAWIDLLQTGALSIGIFNTTDQPNDGPLQEDLRKADAFPPNGLNCVECGAPQFETPSGVSCMNGHGDAPGTKLRGSVGSP